MSDLKIIDELLCFIKQMNSLTWEEVRKLSNITEEAFNRLQNAYDNKEMNSITLSLARYFRGEIS